MDDGVVGDITKNFQNHNKTKTKAINSNDIPVRDNEMNPLNLLGDFIDEIG